MYTNSISTEIQENVTKKELVLIYQVGKVGSSTIYKSLKESNLHNNIYQVHNIANAEKLLDSELKKKHTDSINHLKTGCELKQKLKETKYSKIKIITGVREPISRWVSDIFENLDERYSFLLDEYNQINVQQTLKFIKSSLYDEPMNNWFEEELKEVFGIDIFSYPINMETGFQIIKKDNIEIFLYKLESLNSNLNELSNFLNINNLRFIETNKSLDKKYEYFYKIVLKNLKFSQLFLDEYYMNNTITKHIYKESEIDFFKEKWLEDESTFLSNGEKNRKLKKQQVQIDKQQAKLEQKNIVIKTLRERLEEKNIIISNLRNRLNEKVKLRTILKSNIYKIISTFKKKNA